MSVTVTMTTTAACDGCGLTMAGHGISDFPGGLPTGWRHIEVVVDAGRVVIGDVCSTGCAKQWFGIKIEEQASADPR